MIILEFVFKKDMVEEVVLQHGIAHLHGLLTRGEPKGLLLHQPVDKLASDKARPIGAQVIPPKGRKVVMGDG